MQPRDFSQQKPLLEMTALLLLPIPRFEFAFGAGKERADGCGCDVQRGGNFGVRQTGITEHQQLRLPRLHRAENCAHARAFLFFGDGLCWIAYACFDVPPARVEFVPLPALASTQRVQSQVCRDAVQPAAEIRFLPRRALTRSEPPERFEREVFSFRMIADETDEHAVDWRPVFEERRVELRGCASGLARAVRNRARFVCRHDSRLFLPGSVFVASTHLTPPGNGM